MTPAFQSGIGVLFLLGMLLNLGFAAYYFRAEKKPSAGLLWVLVAALYLVQAVGFLGHLGWSLSPVLTRAVDALMGPVTYTTLSVIAFCAFIYWRKVLTNPHVAWGILNLSIIFAGWAVTNPNFRAIVTKPDNVPIPLLIYSVGFFTWLALRRAVINDERMARGEPPLEKIDDEKVLVWPDLVYTELIAMIVCTALLIVWGIVLKAPL